MKKRFILAFFLLLGLSFFIKISSYAQSNSCPKKYIGDADCASDSAGHAVNILDYAVLYTELINNCSQANPAGCGTDTDHDGNVMDANFNYPGTNYIATDTKVDAFDYAVWIQGYLVQNQNTPTITLTPSVTPSTIPSVTPTKQPTTPITPSSSPTPTTGAVSWWKPTPDKPIHWHWQLTQDFVYPRDVVPGATVYDIDGEKATADTVAKLHALGSDIKVICYFDAGVFETYRSDAGKFPGAQRFTNPDTGKPIVYTGDPQYANQNVIGNADIGWDGSYWMDLRRTDILLPIIKSRMENWCKNKGFDAIEPDETEVWSNNSGFTISKAENNLYNQKIAEMAHQLGLSIGLKGNTTETPDLWPYFDWTLNEECWQYNECSVLKQSFIDHGKAALNIEYAANPNCTQSNAWHLNSAKRDLDLNGPTASSYLYQPCIPNTQNNW